MKEEPIINHYVAKIIENVTSTSGIHSQVCIHLLWLELPLATNINS